MSISVAGLGIVSKIGRVQEIEHYLSQDLINPGLLSAGRHLPVDFPDDYNVSEKLVRRMSHFARLSLLSASQAIKDSGFDVAGKSIGIIQGSVYGPIISGIQAFDDLIDFGDNQLSPTNFSGSVFNTSAAYLSLAFGLQGCTLTHTSGQDTLYNSLLTAGLWLGSGDADYVIVGIGDEYSSFFDDSSPSDEKPGLLPTSEGWTTFILSQDEKTKYGKIEYGYMKELLKTNNGKNIYSVWHEQIKADAFLDHAGDNQACFPTYLRGSYPSAAAFDLAFALICAKNKRFSVYNTIDGNYQNLPVNRNERITLYNLSEMNGVCYYDIIKE